MKKHSLLKREIVFIVIAAISLLLVVVSLVYIAALQRTMAENNRAQSLALTMKDNELNNKIDYTNTICGEYRKLYSAYKNLSGSYYALPGSAKGEVHECYRPQGTKTEKEENHTEGPCPGRASALENGKCMYVW